ncbi:MAG TPA: hypothetical protein DCY07_03740 [Rhodospirillaceae bacterium]|nr:hypothetical protein [Rhodospirillaceae bacterium]
MILWDADGVLFDTFDAEGNFRWAATIEADLGISPACLHEIFHGRWEDVLRGLKHEEDHIAEVFEKHEVNTSPHIFMTYWLGRDNVVNPALWTLLSPANGCIATNQGFARTEMIDEIFAGKVREVYSSARLGVMKPEALYFAKIERKVARPVSTLCLIDDMPENVEAAQRRGWRGHVYTDVPSLLAFLKNQKA